MNYIHNFYQITYWLKRNLTGLYLGSQESMAMQLTYMLININ